MLIGVVVIDRFDYNLHHKVEHVLGVHLPTETVPTIISLVVCIKSCELISHLRNSYTKADVIIVPFLFPEFVLINPVF